MQTNMKNPSWWRRRTTLESCLILLSAFACIVVIGLLCSLLIVLLTNQTAEEINPNTSDKNALALHGSRSCPPLNQICFTTECVHTASAVLSKMDTKIKPCDDFYNFACGKFMKETQIPEDKAHVNTFSLISDKVQLQLKKIIKKPVALTEPKHFRLPNQLYNACMNTALIDTLGTQPIQDISDSMGGWPVLVGDAWDNDNSWTWQDTVENFRHFGFSVNYIMAFFIDEDLKNNTKRIISLDQPFTELNREYLVKGFNDTLVSAYYDYMVEIAVLFGADREAAKTELRRSLQFEIDLAYISLPNERRRNSSELYNLRSVQQLQELYSYVEWKYYINALLPEGAQVNETDVVNLAVPSFFDELGQLLQRTNPRDIANYMMWRIHSFSVAYLPEVFRTKKLEFLTTLYGTQKREARWMECVDVVSTSSLAISVGSLYVRKHFKEDSKVTALEMVDNIRDAFSKLLDENQWMDDATKQKAKTKLHAMATHIGYPDELMDNEKLAEYYRKLEIDPDKYFESYLNIRKFSIDYAFGKLRLPVNKTDWIDRAQPAVVNAYYTATENSIQFPAGILQGHFFNAQRPKYMNYGAIGFVIGHEITHGVDDGGRQFDAEGNLISWWPNDIRIAYLEKARCIIDQYGNYTDKQTGMNLNGINTQGENIADNGGIKEAYLAYKEWASRNAEELSLPSLNYTAKQMFWISAAQNWCATYKTEALKRRINTGLLSPGEFRVLGPLRNMRDFSNDFQCAEGTPMNPVNKCEVW